MSEGLEEEETLEDCQGSFKFKFEIWQGLTKFRVCQNFIIKNPENLLNLTWKV